MTGKKLLTGKKSPKSRPVTLNCRDPLEFDSSIDVICHFK
jgi:hypothetical protein